MTTQNLVGQTQKSEWAKKLSGLINWVGQPPNWVGQCLAGPPIATATVSETPSIVHYMQATQFHGQRLVIHF